MKQPITGFHALEMQIDAVNLAMLETVRLSNAVNPMGYAQLTKKLATASTTMRNAAASTGMFETSQLKLNSAATEYNSMLEKQKLTFRDIFKNQKVARAAYREQIALQNMIVKRVGTDASGRGLYDTFLPTGIHKDMNSLGNKIGWIREQVRSASHQMVNWGKNTQWAGRQLMIGFTMPLAALGAASGVLAFQVDKEMTRIKKVYDTTADSNSKNIDTQIQVQKELMQLEEDATKTTKFAAANYGSAAIDTLNVQAELAATGKHGIELQEATNEVMRISTLGEMDYAESIKATISLQSVFRMSTKELGDAFNYMNAIENATSLQLKDFAAAIPIAAAPLKRMGGTIKTMGILLTAMKERGIEATEGANAIKSAANRLFRPSKQIQEEFTAITGASITDIRDKNKGNIVGMLTDIGKAVKGLDRVGTTKVFSGLFGTYQATRIAAMVDGLGDLENGIGQVSDAQRIGEQSTAQWASAADREIKAWQKSVSGRFTSALETLKTELADFGTPFLEIASGVLEAVGGFLKFFNGLSKGQKRIAAVTAIVVALIPPIVMLTGLMFTFGGTMLKAGVFVTGLLTKFGLLNANSAAAKLATDLRTKGWITETSAIQHLTASVKAMTMANEAAVISMGGMPAAAAATAAAAGVPVKQRMTRQLDGTFTPAKQRMIRQLDGTFTPSTGISQAQPAPQATSGRFSKSGFGGGMLVASGAMAAMAVSSNEVVDDMANIVMYAALLGPALTMLPWGKMSAGVIGMTTKLKGGFIPAIKSGASGIISMLFNFAKFAGPAGLIVGAIGGMVYLNSKINDTAQDMEKLTKTGSAWADIFGFTAREPGTITDPKTGEAVKTLQTQVNELNKAAPEVGESIKNAMAKAGDGFSAAEAEAEAMNLAIRQGLEVMSAGGTAEDATNAVRATLMAGIQDIGKVEDLMAKIKLKVKFNVDKQVIREQVRQTMDLIRQNVDDEVAKNKVEMVMDWIMGQEGSKSEGSKQDIKDAANTFYDQWETANDETKIKMIRAVQIANDEVRNSTIAPLMANEESKAILDKHGITTGAEFLANAGKWDAGDVKHLEASGVNYGTILAKLIDINAANSEFTNELGMQAGLEDGKVDSLEELLTKIVPGYKTIEQATKAYNNQVTLGGLLLGNMSDKQKLVILNQLRVERGQKKTGNLLDMFGPATEKWVDKTKKVGTEQDKVNAKLRQTKTLMSGISNEEITAMTKEAMTTTQEQIADQWVSEFEDKMGAATAAYEEAQNARVEKEEKRAERETKRFDKQWETRMENFNSRWDLRIDKVQDSIKAEEKAEDVRKRIFDAEMQRIDRLNEAANRNIDFNMALNSGDLDEAARIRNDAEAAATGFALSDADAAASEKSAARIDKLGVTEENLNKTKETRLKNLEEVEAAEREALERTQERKRKALEEEVANNIEANQKIWDGRREALDKDVELFKSHIATSEKDLLRWVKKFNIETTGQFAITTENIRKMFRANMRQASDELVNQTNWEVNGFKIANKMLHGAFGMNRQQFRTWMVTGKWPKSNKMPTAAELAASGERAGWTQAQLKAWNEARHKGGEIGTGGGSRDGYARTSAKSRNEVNVLAEKGEFMVNKDMTSKYRSVLERINEGKFTIGRGPRPAQGGPDAGTSLGFAGIMTAMLANAVRTTLGQGVISGAKNMLKQQEGAAGSYTAAKAGTYGDRDFNASQLGFAAIIAGVGANMGMTKRDIKIGIMTAITESGLALPNQAQSDRDSAGLFQQRTSQGWGTVEDIMDPSYASTKFFQALKGVQSRDNMTPWVAAQAVQRSAFSDGSNYKQYWDEATSIYAAMGRVAAVVQGKGGWHLPISGHKVGNSHAPGAGSDISVGTGTPVRAVYNGKVITSKDIFGSNPYDNDGYASYGRYVKLQHSLGGNPYYSLYAHLSKRGVNVGANIKGGTVLGASGSTGNSSGPHLHFEIGPGLSSDSASSPGSFLAARGLPALREGGFTVSDGIAKLHKEEVVLTKPLTKAFNEGIKNFADGPKTTYNLNMNFTGDVTDREEIFRYVVNGLKKIEARKPRSRKG